MNKDFRHRKSFILYSSILIVAAIFSSNTAFSQFYSGSQMSFGKNRVQFDDERTWSYFGFQGFDTYFYADGKSLAIYASSFAHKEIKRIANYIDYTLDDKIKLMIFNDLSDLKETNIGLLTNEEYNIGGETHIIDNKIFIFFNGNHNDFELQISKGIANVYYNQIMYGGPLTSNFKNSILLTFPEWFSGGFISFMAKDWNTEIDNKVRDGFISGKFDNFKNLNTEEQILAGHSIWKYIEEKYGKRALSDVLFLSKINRSIESGFIFVLGVSYNSFMTDWKKWYSDRYFAEMSQPFAQLEKPFKKWNSNKKNLSQAKICPDGKYLIYTENQIGRVKTKLINLENLNSKTLIKYGYKLDEKVDYSYPIFAWAPSGHFLTIILEEKGKNLMKFYDIDKNKWTKRYLMNFDKILSISYNSKGNLMVMSAIQKGQSDIFIYNIGSNTYKRITYDIYDDEKALFVNGSSALVFASNRIDDTLRFDVETGKNVSIDTMRGNEYKDIFYFDLTQGNTLFKRITDTKYADENYPQSLGFNKFSWLSNETGIYNRKIGKLDSTISYIDTIVHYKYVANAFQTSNFAYNIKEQNISTTSNKYVEIIKNNSKDKLYIKDLPDFDAFEKVQPTYTTYILGMNYKNKQKEIIHPKSTETTLPKDSLNILNDKNSIDSSSTNIDSLTQKKKFKVIYVGQTNDNQTNIDINNYNIDGNNSANNTNNLTADNKLKEEKANSEHLYRMLNYDVQFSISELVSQLDFSYMNLSYQPFMNNKFPIYTNQGFAAFMKFGVMDLLEDYRIVGGVKLSPNLKDNEYILNYTNLKKRLDKDYTFHRMVLSQVYEDKYISDYVHEFFFKYSWPIDNVKSIRTTFNLRNDFQVSKSIDHNTLLIPNESSNRAGVKLEFVFDNSRNPAINILYGTRYKIFAEFIQPIENYHDNTYIFGFDYRRYVKIFRTFVWASRAAGSTALGTQKLMYYLGGVDNWLTPNFNQNIQVDQTQKYVYQTIATNLRGFDQNIRNGNNFLVINSELRLPAFQFFSKTPIKSSFLANFMVIGFVDIGTAWTGFNPYADENSLFRQEFYLKPVNIIIINQNDPIVGGYGFGLRTQIFGYYVRADWAHGIQNGFKEKTQFYLSFSLDF